MAPTVVADLKDPCDLMAGSLGRVGVPSPVAVGGFHQRIRRETRNAHDIVDDAMSVFDLHDAETYGHFLANHAQAIARLRPHLGRDDQADIQEMAECVDADLRALGATRHAPKADAWDLDGLGVAYVLRGSRMGALVLRRRIGPDLPTRYMDFTPALKWRDFLAALEVHAAVAGQAGRRHIVASAQKAFEAFAPPGGAA